MLTGGLALLTIIAALFIGGYVSRATAAIDRGIKVSLSVDAHSMRELDNIRYALLLAQRAGVRRRHLVSLSPLRARTAGPRPGP